MNTERLHIIASAIRNDIAETKTVGLLQQLATALQNQVNQPQVPQHQQTVSQSLTTLYALLDRAPSNAFSPAWHAAIDELDASPYLGLGLKYEIEQIFAQNKITPSVAMQEIQKLLRDVSSLNDAVSQLLTAYTRLGIGAEELAPGQCELGILVPRSFVNNQLDKFGDELTKLDRIFGIFSEIVTGQRPPAQIRSISSSELSVFLDSAPSVAACAAVTIERVVALYKQLLEIRKLHAELKKQGLKDQSLKGVGDHADTMMNGGIEKIADETLKEFGQIKDAGRKNELIVELRIVLKQIAARIDRGFNIEVRVGPPATADEHVSKKQAEKEAHDIALITKASENLQFIKLEGPPILKLPDNVQDGAKKKVQQSGKSV